MLNDVDYESYPEIMRSLELQIEKLTRAKENLQNVTQLDNEDRGNIDRLLRDQLEKLIKMQGENTAVIKRKNRIIYKLRERR